MSRIIQKILYYENDFGFRYQKQMDIYKRTTRQGFTLNFLIFNSNSRTKILLDLKTSLNLDIL